MASSTNYPKLKIVPIEDIPNVEDVRDVPLDDLAEIYKICVQMKCVCEAENGVGLAAVQVGLPLNLFIIKGQADSKIVRTDEFGFFINTNYSPLGHVPRDSTLHNVADTVTSLEGCLSIRSPEGRLRHFQVERLRQISINGYLLKDDTKLEIEELRDAHADGFEAIIIQHEADHQRGVLISDIGQEVFLWK